MIWIGISIGIIFTSIFGMTLLLIMSKNKQPDPIPPELKGYWVESMRCQRLNIEALMSISEAVVLAAMERKIE